MATVAILLVSFGVAGLASFLGSSRATRNVSKPLDEIATALHVLQAERRIYDITADTFTGMVDAARGDRER